MRTAHLILGSMIILCVEATAQTAKLEINLSSDAHLTLTKTQFNPKVHKVEYSASGEYAITIDNKPIFGTDGEMPQSQLVGAVLTIGTKKYNLDVSAMFNPWIGDAFVNQRAELKRGGKGARRVLRISLSDGAGSYAAEWTIEGNGSIRTILSDDEWITIEYFEK